MNKSVHLLKWNRRDSDPHYAGLIFNILCGCQFLLTELLTTFFDFD